MKSKILTNTEIVFGGAIRIDAITDGSAITLALSELVTPVGLGKDLNEDDISKDNNFVYLTFPNKEVLSNFINVLKSVENEDSKN